MLAVVSTYSESESDFSCTRDPQQLGRVTYPLRWGSRTGLHFGIALSSKA